jgi:hypothetical protein
LCAFAGVQNFGKARLRELFLQRMGARFVAVDEQYSKLHSLMFRRAGHPTQLGLSPQARVQKA